MTIEYIERGETREYLLRSLRHDYRIDRTQKSNFYLYGVLYIDLSLTFDDYSRYLAATSEQHTPAVLYYTHQPCCTAHTSRAVLHTPAVLDCTHKPCWTAHSSRAGLHTPAVLYCTHQPCWTAHNSRVVLHTPAVLDCTHHPCMYCTHQPVGLVGFAQKYSNAIEKISIEFFYN